MELFDELKKIGVDIDRALLRLNGNVSLYARLLDKFAKMIQTLPVQEDFDNQDFNGAVEKTHAIKGTAGNLSITPLYEAYTDIVRLLREGETEKARAVLEDIIPVQKNIIDCIERYSA